MGRTKGRSSEQINWKWPRALREALERTAAELGVSPGNLVRGLVSQYLLRRAGTHEEDRHGDA